MDILWQEIVGPIKITAMRDGPVVKMAVDARFQSSCTILGETFDCLTGDQLRHEKWRLLHELLDASAEFTERLEGR